MGGSAYPVFLTFRRGTLARVDASAPASNLGLINIAAVPVGHTRAIRANLQLTSLNLLKRSS